MAAEPRYRRILVKVSGESFCGPGGRGIESSALQTLVDELLPVCRQGVQMGVVVGAGNLIRGRDLSGSAQVRRVTADYMGMGATIINALALRDALQACGADATVLSGLELPPVVERFSADRAGRCLEAGQVVILAGGTGSPFFTTDTCAALRAQEIGAEVMFKATKVDGVFDADPAARPDAKKYETLSYEKVLADRLGVMDLTAISMCMDSELPIVVFQLARPGNLLAAVRGEKVGTAIGPQS